MERKSSEELSDELMPRAIPEEDLDENENESPEAKAAALYLRGVRNEAKNIGAVVATQKTTDYSEKQTSYLPKSVVREYFQEGQYTQIPQKFREGALKRFNELKQIVNNEREKYRKEKKPFDKSQNFVSLMGLSKKTSVPTSLPEYEKIVHLSEIVVHDTIGELLEKIRKSKVGFSYEYGLWIFALLLVVEKPLVPDMSAELNDLLGYVIGFQRETQDKTEVQNEVCDLIIVIIAEYFGQRPM